MVNVYYRNKVVGRVKYNDNLDHWDGHNWTCGAIGRHLGITRLRKPIDGLQFVLIHGTQWEGERDWAELVTDGIALQEILNSECEELLHRYFPSHKMNLDEE